MTNGAHRRRRQAQKGVEAVFTSDGDKHNNVRYAAGLLTIGTGAALWIWGIRPLASSNPKLIQLSGLTSSLILMSVAMSMVIGGVGWSTYLLAVRRTKRENSKIRSAIYELEALVGSKNGAQEPSQGARLDIKLPEGQTSSRRVSKSLTVALAEAVMLIIVYAGLVQEYISNTNMQQWVHTNIGFGAYFLNYNVVLILTTALSGALAYQILRTGRSSSKITESRPGSH